MTSGVFCSCFGCAPIPGASRTPSAPGASGTAFWVVAAIVVVSAVPGLLRWLRVAQREHYLAGSTLRFALRWWRAGFLNRGLLAAALAAVVATAWEPLAVLAVAVVSAVGPVGLSLRGRTSPLRWTRRLTTLAVVVVGVSGGAIGVDYAAVKVGAVALSVVGAVVLVLPLAVDVALLATSPVEKFLARRFVRTATARLARDKPTVVAVTGSYGKTSTKVYIAHLLASRYSVVSSPASFNNTAGLARAVNESLPLGADVFVAEMGTYGKGEIASLCRWLVPDVAVITAIGPVHLERMKSEEAILEAKAEICAGAAAVVLNVDDPRLAALADRLAGSGRTVLRASATGSPVAPPPGASPTNVACAVEVARHLGVGEDEIARRVPTLPDVPNRRTSYVSDAGFTVVDDTYNSNPAGCREALARVAGLGSPGGRKVVVTPGMVELGRRQAAENRDFAAAAVAAGARLVVVGRTNRAALLAGAGAPARAGAAGMDAGAGAGGRGSEVRTVTVRTRPEAVAWVRAHLDAGDVVLYENDLPDHYP